VSTGVAFRCGEGIVIGTDTQYTSSLKLPGIKLFEIHTKDATLCIAGSGRVSLIRKAVQLVEREISKTQTVLMDAVEDALEGTLDTIYTKYIDRFHGPEEHRPDLALLVGAKAEETQVLFKSEERVTNRVDDYEVIGTGGPLVQYIVETLTLPGGYRKSLSGAKLVALYALKAARDYDVWSGRETSLKVLHNDGTIETASNEEIRSGEEYFEDLFTAMHGAVLIAPDDSLTGKEFLEFAISQHFEVAMKDFRQRELERRKKNERIAKLRTKQKSTPK